jgi:hypothetical protein
MPHPNPLQRRGLKKKPPKIAPSPLEKAGMRLNSYTFHSFYFLNLSTYRFNLFPQPFYIGLGFYFRSRTKI